MVTEMYLILATGETHSEIRDEFDLKGRFKFLPSPPVYRPGSGRNPLEEDNMKKICELAKLYRQFARLNARIEKEPELKKELDKVIRKINKIHNG